MNEALQQLEPLVGDWEVTLTHAWFLDSLDTEIRGTATVCATASRGPMVLG
jgi:hypothetical protein